MFLVALGHHRQVNNRINNDAHNHFARVSVSVSVSADRLLKLHLHCPTSHVIHISHSAAFAEPRARRGAIARAAPVPSSRTQLAPFGGEQPVGSAQSCHVQRSASRHIRTWRSKGRHCTSSVTGTGDSTAVTT